MTSHNSRPKWRVQSQKRPYRTNKFGHTHDCWTVDIRDDSDANTKYTSKFHADYNKEEAKEKAREVAAPGEKIRIEDMDGNLLRVEEVSQE